MAYGNYYPYQNYQMPQNNSIIWVNGIEGARAYIVAPNQTVPLWDTESQTIYLKSADQSGMPSIKIIDYTERAVNPPQNNVLKNTEDFVTREEFNALQSKFESILKEKENESVIRTTEK